MSVGTPLVSIVVPAFNAALRLPRLFDSLEALATAVRFEVIVVDDCSTDNTASVIQDWCNRPLPFERRLVALTINGGPGRARNAGAKVATGSHVAFTDSDCRVTPEWLAHLLSALQTRPELVGAGGAVRPTETSLFADYFTVLGVLEPPPGIEYLVTCNCLYLRDAFLDAGGFPEDIPVAGGEDIELSIRLWKRGGRFVFAPDAVVFHEHRDTWRSFARTWRNYGYGTGLALQRALTFEEQTGLPSKVQHYWDGAPFRPRLLLERLQFLWQRRSQEGWSAGYTGLLSLLWMIERLMYLRGWRQARGHSR